MSVVKVIELIGVSENSFEEAVKNALEEAQKTVRGISGIKVISWSADVEDGTIVRYKANVKIAFKVERE